MTAIKHIPNFKMVNDDIAISGQIAEPYFPYLHKEGFGLVIEIKVDGVGTRVQNEERLVEENGMLYASIEIDFNNPSIVAFQQLANLLNQFRKLKVLVHCAAGYCSAALLLPYLVNHLGYSVEEAQSRLHEIPNQWEAIVQSAIYELKAA